MTGSDVVKWAKELNEGMSWNFYINNNTPTIDRCREHTVHWFKEKYNKNYDVNAAEVTKVMYTAISLLPANLYDKFSDGAHHGVKNYAVADPEVITTAQDRLYKTFRSNMPLMLKGHLHSSNFTEHLIGYVFRNLPEIYKELGMSADNYHPVRDRLRQFYPPPPITPLAWHTPPWQSYDGNTEEYEQSYKEYEEMNKNYEEKQYVLGNDAATMTLDGFVNAIVLIEGKIKHLKSVKTKSKAIKKQVKQYRADILSIVALMDKEMDK